MKRIVRTPLAVQDLLQIWDYIAVKSASPQAAGGLLRRIDAVLQRILHHPEIGERYSRQPSEIRIFPVGSYLLIYRPIGEGVQLLRILHGTQDWEELL